MDKRRIYGLCEEAAGEGCVLLENKNETLPLAKGEKVSVFGRIQMDYYKSGTGSGGLVNTEFVIGIMDALTECGDIEINMDLYRTYEEWISRNPFNMGEGWAAEPWCQEEMELTDEVVEEAASKSSTALVVIGRTAGEDHDNSAAEGSYLLTKKEEDMIAKVRKGFDRMAVILNVGNILDMKWVDKYEIPAVLYVWQGGMLGGKAVCDILTGKVNPSGKLSDTIAYDISDYPSYTDFGDDKRNYYREDIYVGYRYFETFCKEKARYPFGYGLSYTRFSTAVRSAKKDGGNIRLEIEVTNNGKREGKEVVQIYYSAPQGLLGKPARQLATFRKTRLLKPEETEVLEITFPIERMASYDDSGVTGYRYSYVLEKGEYVLYAGNSVRNCTEALRFMLESNECVEVLSQALAPVREFQRIKPAEDASGSLVVEYEEVPLRTYDLKERIEREKPADLFRVGEENHSLKAVAEGAAGLEAFIAGLSDEELCCIVRGEGMCSPKATPGTASAFGGLTPSLKDKGVPIGCCADGPSGIRMDCGTLATSLPSGTCIACSWNTELTESLFEETGHELVENRIDILLGPGMNIHRFPLNGRNFEYFSEDPVLTGKMAAAELKGMHKAGVTGAIKHFAANNQEYKRTEIDAVISERALREIYLKGFEIAVQEGAAKAVMTMYGGINGIWTAGNYDLNTRILREEWGFKGIVMTDWWAKMNDENEIPDAKNTKAMVIAQNDLYMVVEDALTNSAGDNLKAALESGSLSRGQLQRCAKNICEFLLDSHAMERMLRPDDEGFKDGEDEDSLTESIEFEIKDHTEIPLIDIAAKKGLQLTKTVWVEKGGKYSITIRYKSSSPKVAQIPVSVSIKDNTAMFIMNGTDNQWMEMKKEMTLLRGKQYLKIFFGQQGAELFGITLDYIV